MTTINPRCQSDTASLVPQLRDDIAALASRLLRNVPHLTDTEKQILWDLQRPKRYQWEVLRRLAEMCSRSPDPADREALPRCLREWTTRREHEFASANIVALEDEETLDRGALDIAEHRLQVHNCPATRHRLAEAADRERNVLERMQRALVSMH